MIPGSGLDKREQIKQRLKDTFKRSEVKFSEELSADPKFKKTPLGTKDLLPHKQELWHLALCDVCVVLDTSVGPGEEIAHFVETKYGYKMFIRP